MKYSKQLNLERAKKVKSLEDRLSLAVEVGDSLAVDLAVDLMMFIMIKFWE